MGRTALAERIGTVLHLVELGGEAEIVRSYKVSGDFPANREAEVTFDFAKRRDAAIIVQLTRAIPGRTKVRKDWTLSAIQDRDAKGLVGFTDFAKSLGITGANLANLIEGMKPAS